MREPDDLTKPAGSEENEADSSSADGLNAAAPIAPQFRLMTVEKASMPDGGTGETWYRYVLENGHSTIVGHRSGSVAEVTKYATDYAEQLNARSVGGQSAWTPRSKKPT